MSAPGRRVLLVGAACARTEGGMANKGQRRAVVKAPDFTGVLGFNEALKVPAYPLAVPFAWGG